jgi:hypothetical protein
MVDINEVFGGETLKAADLQGKEFTLTIQTVQAKDFDKGSKLVIRFVGAKKVLISNRTNAKRIAMLYGSNTDTWVGRQVTLYSEMVDFKGEPTWAIRVKQPPGYATLPMPAVQQPAPAAAPILPPAPDFDDPMPDMTSGNNRTPF